MAEGSKALASGASPQGRGFEPHSCHFHWFDLQQFQQHLLRAAPSLNCNLIRHAPLSPVFAALLRHPPRTSFSPTLSNPRPSTCAMSLLAVSLSLSLSLSLKRGDPSTDFQPAGATGAGDRRRSHRGIRQPIFRRWAPKQGRQASWGAALAVPAGTAGTAGLAGGCPSACMGAGRAAPG